MNAVRVSLYVFLTITVAFLQMWWNYEAIGPLYARILKSLYAGLVYSVMILLPFFLCRLILKRFWHGYSLKKQNLQNAFCIFQIFIMGGIYLTEMLSYPNPGRWEMFVVVGVLTLCAIFCLKYNPALPNFQRKKDDA